MHEKRGMGRLLIRRRRFRAALTALLAAFQLFASSAQASWDLEAPDLARGFVGEAGLSLAAWPDLAPGSLQAMRDWLSGLRLGLYVQEERESFTLYEGERALLRADSARENGVHSLLLSVPDGPAPTLYLGTSEETPLGLLFGAQALPDFSKAWEALPRLSQALLSGLLPFEESQATRTNIRQAGRAESRLNYVLSAQEANAWWQAALPQARTILQEGTAALPASFRAAATAALEGLEFTGKFTLRRLLDGAGQDVGLQAAAGIQVLGEARKLDLTAGFQADNGLYLSLKLPAARGKDKLEALISLAFTHQEGISRAKGDYSLTEVSQGNTRSLAGKVDMSLSPQGAGQRLTGSLTANLRHSGGLTLKRDHSFSPDFLIQTDRLAGQLHWTEAEGKTLLKDLSLTLELSPGTAPAALFPQARVDLAGASQAERDHAARQAAEALMPYLREKLLQLPQETRLVLLHDWGRVRRALGESDTALLSENTPGAFTVTEDADTLP